MFELYLGRKRRQLDRLVAAYVRPDGATVGRPPELRAVTPGMQGLLAAVQGVQAETFIYAGCAGPRACAGMHMCAVPSRPLTCPAALEAGRVILHQAQASDTLLILRRSPPPPISPHSPHVELLVPPVLEHLTGALAARYAALDPLGLPPEALAQYFLDLAWLDALTSASGGGGGLLDRAQSGRAPCAAAQRCCMH